MTEPQEPFNQPANSTTAGNPNRDGAGNLCVEMGRKHLLEISSCKQCPYAYGGIHKGLTNGEFYCLQVYDDLPNFQGSCRSLGTQYTYGPTPGGNSPQEGV